MIAGSAVQKLMQSISKEQEILLNLADITIQIYQAESALLRTEKHILLNGEDSALAQIAMTKTFFYDAASIIEKSGKDALNSFAEGDELRMMLMGMKRFTKVAPFNTKNARQRIAQKAIDKNEYCFSDAINKQYEINNYYIKKAL